MSGIISVHHVQLAMPAGDEEAARRFYSGLLGIAEVSKPAELAKRGGVWFETDGVKIHLGVEQDFRPARKAHPGLLVRDLQSLSKRLTDAGHQVTNGEPLAGYQHIYVYDPFGNRLELLEAAGAAELCLKPRHGVHIRSKNSMKIIGISGSLRTVSLSTGLLETAAALAPFDVRFMVYDGIGNLPHFNPELDTEPAPAAVSDFRSQLNSSAGVVIATPEYAHGIPGALKNALDWLVASGELYEKPVALFSASPYARFAPASLIETLSVMMARLIPDAFINISAYCGLENGELQETGDVGLSTRVERARAALTKAIDPTYTLHSDIKDV